jgi:uncharacterized Rossmann fold enzyme
LLIRTHRDNIDKLEKYTPSQALHCNLQERSPDKVYNFGRFSNGSRCIFIAREFGANNIRLVFFVLNVPMLTRSRKRDWSGKRNLCGFKPF